MNMNTISKSFCLLVISLLWVFSLPGDAYAYDFAKFNNIPPFIATGEAPSVLLLCDSSGSMDHFAYAKPYTGQQYDQDTVYYGYFDPYAYYRYVKCEDTGDSYARSGFFEENTTGWTDSKGQFHGNWDGNEDCIDNVDPAGTGTGVGNYEWSGNFLNYISMRRTDIFKRVLMGGRRAPSNFSNIFDNAPAGYPTGAAVNPLDYLVVGDYLYYGSRRDECNDYKVPLPPGPTLSEPTKPAASHFLTPYGTGAGPVTLDYETYYNDQCGDNDYHRPFYLKFYMASISNLPSEARGERRKLLALKLPDENSDGFPDQPWGIVQRTGSQVRFGAMRFNRSDNEGGNIMVPVGNTDHLCTPISTSCGSVCAGYGPGSDNLGDGFRMNGVIRAINDLEAAANTPLGESLATAVLYYQQNDPHYHAGDFTKSKEWDPYFFNKDMNKDCSVGASEGEYVVCSRGYVIVLTDGEPTSDSNIPAWVTNYTDGGNDGTKRIDDVARYAHITDLRPNDESHDGNTYEFSTMDNTINTYPVFTFGAGGTLLRSTARNGGFIDKNSDDKPNTIAEEAAAAQENKEWDFDGDGEPDNYFEATSGEAIESSLISALSDILKRAASGSAASIISGSRPGARAIFQAIFYPEMQEPSGTRKVAWTGYLHALFIDEYGNMWEDCDGNGVLEVDKDSDGDGVLDADNDRIIQLYWSDIENATKVKFYKERLPSGLPDPGSLHPDSNDSAKNNIINIKPVWEAGRKLTEWTDTQVLTQRTYNLETGGRYIFTWVDLNNDGIVGGGEVMAFDEANRPNFENFFDLPAPADPDYISPADLVQWIRGKDLAGYRSRQINFNGTGVKTWRLGDIIYSTPTVVGPPAESLDLIYGDTSYRAFYYTNRDRRQMVYTGANDGMIHAFNAGFYDEVNHEYKITSGTKTPYALGQELWAFVPFDLIPHLQALPQADYDSIHGNHVCFVDLKPRVMDVKFSDGLWHTVMVCGMRLGGGEVAVNGDTLKSAYFALDVTDPENPPQLLWSFNDTHGTSPAAENCLGFTTSYPAVVNVYDDTNGSIKNYVVLGSGLTTLNSVYSSSKDEDDDGDGVFDPGEDDNSDGLFNTPNYPVKSDQRARLYAIDIETGAATVLATVGDDYSYFADPVSIDLNYKTEQGVGWPHLCYASELVYVGISYDNDNDFLTPGQGKIYRLTTMKADGSPETDPSQWSVSLLCDVEKPVTSAPNVTVAGIRGRINDHKAYINVNDDTTLSYVPLVYFGTGEYWFSQDKGDISQQTFFGIKEPVSVFDSDPGVDVDNAYVFTWSSVNPAYLMNVSDTVVYTNGWVDVEDDGRSPWASAPADPVNSTTWLNRFGNTEDEDPPNFDQWINYLMKVDPDNNPPDLDHFSKYHGWKIDLNSSAERVVGQPGVLGGVVIFSSYLPSNEVCVTSGTSLLYALHYLTGSAYYEPILGEDTTKSVTEGTDTYYASKKTTSLGEGMGITPTFHSGGGGGDAKAFVQTSTGSIVEIDVNTVFDLLGPGLHLRSWRNR